MFNFLCLLLCLSSIYLVPRSEIDHDTAIMIDSAIAFILIISSILKVYIDGKCHPGPFPFFIPLVFMSLMLCPFGSKLFNIHAFYLLIAAYAIDASQKWRAIELAVIFLFSLFILYNAVSPQEDGVRYSILSIDPNYFSYYSFLLFIYCRSINARWLGIVYLLVGALTLSRAFYLGIFMLLLWDYVYKLFPPRLLRITYPLLCVILPIALSYIYLSFFETPLVVREPGIQRLIAFGDKSNLDRAISNISYIDHVIDKPMSLLTGIEIHDYLDTRYSNTPHNSFMATTFNYGVFYTIAAYLLLLGIGESKEFWHFKIAILPFVLFLGGVLFGPQVLLIQIIHKRLHFKSL